MPVTSVANDKGHNETIPRAVDRSSGICLTSEGNPGKLLLGDRLMKGLCDQSLSQMGSLSSKWGNAFSMLSMGTWAATKKSFMLVWRYHQLLSWFVAKGHLPLVSRLSVNDKDDNEILPRVVYRSLGICLKAEENPGKLPLGDRQLYLCYQSSLQLDSLTCKWGVYIHTVHQEGKWRERV